MSVTGAPVAVGLLLAAGASRRFGPEDKLLAPLRGRPLVWHAAQALRAVALDHRIAVIANPDLAPLLDGFTLVIIPPGPMSASLGAGLRQAGRPDRLLIALGDMPDVTPGHLRAILDHAGPQGPACSRDGSGPMPPACFPAEWLDRLEGLQGDQGAGRLLRDLPADRMIAAPGLLRDIDRPSDMGGCGGSGGTP